jgi:hypothetical protein
MGTIEFIIIAGILLIISLGVYGKDTSLGFFGSLLLSCFSTPVIAFVVIFLLRRNDEKNRRYMYEHLNRQHKNY